MTKVLRHYPNFLDGIDAFQGYDDFFSWTDTAPWTETTENSGGAVIDADGQGGILDLATGSTDNNESYLETPEWFDFTSNRPGHWAFRLKYSEANTDDANVMFGLMDAPGADSLLDDGGGPKASYSGALFYKTDGGTAWNVESSVGASQTTTALTAANSDNLSGVVQTAASTTFKLFEIEYYPGSASSSSGKIVFRIDGVDVAIHDITYTSVTEMALVIGVKAGGSNAETVNIDAVFWNQLRAA